MSDDNWLEEERLKCLKLQPVAYGMIFMGYLVQMVPAVRGLWNDSVLGFLMSAAHCLFTSIVFPFFARSLKVSFDSLRAAKAKPPETL